MMKVICKCGTEVEMTVIGGQYQHTYEGTCPKCERIWQLKDVLYEVDEDIKIGEHGVPAECENADCDDCGLSDFGRKSISCPYME